MIKCVICKKDIDSDSILSGKSFFHYYSVHGIDEESLKEIISKVVKVKNIIKQ